MKKSRIFQHNSYRTLYGGFYEGTITAREALKHGAIGIGTLDGADGEVIILNGTMYHGDSDNHVNLVSSDKTLPYVALLDHQAQFELTADDLDFEKLLSAMRLDSPLQRPSESGQSSAESAKMTENISNPNVPYSIKIDGLFKQVEITSKTPNNTSGTPYLDILSKQPHFTKENVEGTIVGIWSPKHLESLYGSGFHLHFISADRKFGAHLANFTSGKVHVEFGQIDQMKQEFASDNAIFDQMNF